MGSPQQKRTVFGVVVAVVVFRHFDGETFAKIAFVLAVQGDTVVFRVTHYKNLAAVFCHGKKKTCFVGFCKDSKVFAGMYIFNRMKDAIIVHSIEELMEELKKYPAEDVYCIGGDTIYKQLLPYCDAAQVTKIDFAYIADSYFPNLDEDPQWHVAAESEEQTYFDLEYKFVRYERNK